MQFKLTVCDPKYVLRNGEIECGKARVVKIKSLFSIEEEGSLPHMATHKWIYIHTQPHAIRYPWIMNRTGRGAVAALRGSSPLRGAELPGDHPGRRTPTPHHRCRRRRRRRRNCFSGGGFQLLSFSLWVHFSCVEQLARPTQPAKLGAQARLFPK